MIYFNPKRRVLDLADEGKELNSYQRSAVNKLLENDGSVLICHPMGSGKTRTSIEGVEELKRQGKAKVALAVVPASLRSNYLNNGVNKYTKAKGTILGSITEEYPDIYDNKIPKSDYYIVSYDMFKKDPQYYLERTGADTLVVDEMHNFRNEKTKNYVQMKGIRGQVRNFIGLTGTPFNNHPADIRPLIDIVSNGKHILGNNNAEFNNMFVTKIGDREVLRNKKLLADEMNKWVHYVSLDRVNKSADVPKKVVEEVEIEMSPLQKLHYDFVMRKVPPDVRRMIREGMPINRKEAFHILPMLIQARGVSNTINYVNDSIPDAKAAEYTPKIRKALDDIEQHLQEDSKGQVVVHSHLVAGGTNIISAGLSNRKIPHGILTGKTPTEERDKVVNQYNKGKLKALIISSAGTTGLNLPNTTMHVALDGHYNPAVTDQIEARGIRAGGQSYKPVDERRVIVKRYKTVFPPGMMNKLGLRKKPQTVDQWIYNLAEFKGEINADAEHLLKSAKEATNPKKDYSDTNLYNQGMLGIGGAALASGSVYPAVGQVHMYHGTSKKNWESIKHEGLDPAKGGRGGASEFAANESYIKNSSGYVHATRLSPLANMYARFDGLGEHLGRPLNSDEFHRVMSGMGTGMGKRVNMSINYDKYKRMEVDTDSGATSDHVKFVASKTKEKINPDEIFGSTASKGDKAKRVLNYIPKYYRNHTGRAMLSLGGLAAGIGAMGYAGDNIVGSLNQDKVAAYDENTTKLLAKLRDDLAGEHDAINLYQKHIDTISIPSIKAKLKHIRNEEREHVEELEKLIDKEDGSQNKEAAEIVGYHYAKDGKYPENILNYSEDKQREIVKSMRKQGLNRSMDYMRVRGYVERSMEQVAKEKLGDKIKLKHPLYFRIGRDPKGWSGYENEFKIDPKLLSKSTFTIGDSFDHLHKFRRSKGGTLPNTFRDQMLSYRELKAKPKEEIKEHPFMQEGKGGNYIEGQLWVPYKVDGKKIVEDKEMSKSANAFYQDKSSIAGTGNFSEVGEHKGDRVGLALVKLHRTGNPDNDIKRHILCTYTNHSNKPNMIIKKIGRNYYFEAAKNIKPNEELTVNYDTFDFDGLRNF